eukprot:ANDGO_02156.mRNA.1 hypothetical protein
MDLTSALSSPWPTLSSTSSLMRLMMPGSTTVNVTSELLFPFVPFEDIERTSVTPRVPTAEPIGECQAPLRRIPQVEKPDIRLLPTHIGRIRKAEKECPLPIRDPTLVIPGVNVDKVGAPCQPSHAATQSAPSPSATDWVMSAASSADLSRFSIQTRTGRIPYHSWTSPTNSTGAARNAQSDTTNPTVGPHPHPNDQSSSNVLGPIFQLLDPSVFDIGTFHIGTPESSTSSSDKTPINDGEWYKTSVYSLKASFHVRNDSHPWFASTCLVRESDGSVVHDGLSFQKHGPFPFHSKFLGDQMTLVEGEIGPFSVSKFSFVHHGKPVKFRLCVRCYSESDKEEIASEFTVVSPSFVVKSKKPKRGEKRECGMVWERYEHNSNIKKNSCDGSSTGSSNHIDNEMDCSNENRDDSCAIHAAKVLKIAADTAIMGNGMIEIQMRSSSGSGVSLHCVS